MSDVKDLLDSANLDIDSLCKNQLEKFNEGQKFTYIGNILLSLNTLKDLEVYSSEVAQNYFNTQAAHNLPAHIYATGYEIFTTLMKKGNNQTVIPYGISGSGKSVCCQLLVQSLAELTCKKTRSNDMFQKLSAVGSFMDMFLNAKTNLNVNSTRCAKLIQMFVSSSGICEGVFPNETLTLATIPAFFSFYMLDKSRLSQLQTNERNFHILYYMLAGLSDKERKLNLLDNPDKHKLVMLTDGSEIFKDPSYLKACKQKWGKFNDYLNLFGFIPEERGSVLAVLTGILHLKDLHFIHDHDIDGVGVSNEEILDTASHMLGLNVDVLAGYLLTFEITVKGSVDF
ncbi:hypothetical protein HELRODRAFT_168991 [Helobdella robusta]|uniref:Myosin motor domain-containing protein n=1 Tax=Helobdella robusta TaxID=6412 RepID=T1F183_HELRO|nr:hypothetical protein HELRODRAFT_168991 [Helobdella robusta]ESO09055.1 hypothetical protein HELRODRAFT_168991 [Helobdella robusta]